MTHLSRPGAVLAATLAVALMAALPAASATRATAWGWPLQPVPHVVHPFAPPSSPYGPGHRGVDLTGTVGQEVLSVAAGTVAFAGSVAGRGVVVIDHGVLSSTYQPVIAYVSAGERVTPGEPLGSLELVGTHCLPDACLHLGAKRGDVYLDPLGLLPARPVRLKPLAGLGSAGRAGGTERQTFQLPRGRPESRPQGSGWFVCGGATGAIVGLSAGSVRGAPAGYTATLWLRQALGWACW